MVRLYEFQGKQLLRKVAVPVPEGDLASTPEEARRIAEKVAKPVIVKTQIWATGRFKARGIKLAENLEQAEKARRVPSLCRDIARELLLESPPAEAEARLARYRSTTQSRRLSGSTDP